MARQTSFNLPAHLPAAGSYQFTMIPAAGMIIPEMGMTLNANTPATPVSGLGGVLFTPVQQRVLGLLFGQPDRRF
jgi:hypothetical protein